MVGGKLKQERALSVDEIFSVTNGGRDVFQLYLGRVKRIMKRPWGKDDHPSFGIVPHDGIYFYKDFATGESGTAVSFVMKYFSLSFEEALRRICGDLGLSKERMEGGMCLWEQREKEEKRSTHIAFSTTTFDEGHRRYWNEYGLNEDFLNEHGVFRVRELAINHREIKMGAEELCFSYYADDIERCKILRIGVPKDMKWRNSVPGNYIWLKSRYERCERLIIAKSLKDALVLKSLGVCTVAVQSEDAKGLEDSVEELKGISDNIVVHFGSDLQGKRESVKITSRWGFTHYNTPDHLLPVGINDIAEFIKGDREGALKHLREKNII